MSQFERKTYVLVAGIVSAISNENERNAIAHYHADKFLKDNPRFSKSLFLKACGVKKNASTS